MDLVHLVLDGISMAKEEGDEAKLPLKATYNRSINRVRLGRTSVREGGYPCINDGDIYALNESLHEAAEGRDEVNVDYEMVYDRTGNRARLVRKDENDGQNPEELTSVHTKIKSEAVAKQEDKKQSPGQERPEQENRAEVDLSRENIASRLSPEERERLMVAVYSAHADEDPARAEAFGQRLVEMARSKTPPLELQQESQPEMVIKHEGIDGPSSETNVSWPDLVARLPEKLRPYKEAMHRVLEETLRAGVGWRGTTEESSQAVETLKTETAECGRRFAYSTSDAVIPVSVTYHQRVFKITADPKFPGVKKNGYVASTAKFPKLATLPRQPRSKES